MANLTTTAAQRGRPLIVPQGYIYGGDRDRGITNALTGLVEEEE